MVTLAPAPDHEREPVGAGAKRFLFWAAAAFALLVGLLVALHLDELTSIIGEVPLWAAAGAVGAQVIWLALRGEAWRVALNAVGPREVPRASAHVANALAFGAGAVQSLATVPVRALALRRQAAERSPTLEQILVADAPVLALEMTLMGLVLVIAVATGPRLSAWGAAGVLASGAVVLALLASARERFQGRGLVAGLTVLGDRRRLPKLAGIATAMSGVALARSWFVLVGFDLPHSFAGVAGFLAALGIAAALPIGLASSPAAALAVFGASDASRAAAAGVAMAASSLLAVAIYGSLALLIAVGRQRPGTASRRATGPEPV